MNTNTLVTINNLKQCIRKILKADVLACDTETTGLKPFLGHRLFSIIITTEDDNFYFNYNTKDALFITKFCELIPRKTGTGYLKKTKIIRKTIFIPIPKENILPYKSIALLNPIFGDPKRLVDFHNAKFDMHFLAKEGIKFLCICFCTQSGARINLNNLPTYALSYLAKLIGEEKSDEVTSYVKEHKLANKETGSKNYDLVIFSVISSYGFQDGRVTFKLGKKTRERIKEKDLQAANISDLKLDTVLQNELILTKTLYKMERAGFLCDQEYTQKAFDYSVAKYKKCETEFGMMTGMEFSDGELTLAPAFKALDLEYGLTKGGKPSFADSVLEGLDHPLAEIIQGYRKGYKNAHTYFENFLKNSDINSLVHCNFRQGGTTHGRLSCTDPNLQNVPKEKKDKDGIYISKFPVRRCFVPHEGYFFLMPDYDQMEYRLMLDYANEKSVIDMVLGGMDVHEATKEAMGIKDNKDMTARDVAKKINFLLLYGGGVALLAIELFKLTIDIDLLKEIWTLIWKEKLNEYQIASRCNIEDAVAIVACEKLEEAAALRRLYFTKLPNVKNFIKGVQEQAARRGYVFNWYGRRCHFNKGHEYKAPNHIISGGCADIVKIAMNEVDKLLVNHKSKMLIQVHDEIVLEIKKGEEKLIPKIKKIMQEVYPFQHIPLTVGVDWSPTSWADKQTWEL